MVEILNEKKNNKKNIVTLLIIIVAVVIISVIGFIVINKYKENARKYDKPGIITFSCDSPTNGVSIVNAKTFSDDEGMKLENTDENIYVINFKVKAELDKNGFSEYEVAVIPENNGDDKYIDNEDIRLYLEKDGKKRLAPTAFQPMEENSVFGTPAGSMIIDKASLKNKSKNKKIITNKYKLRVWVSDKHKKSIENKKYNLNVFVFEKRK